MEQEQRRIRKIQEELKEGKPLTFLPNEDIRYLEKPLGKAIYKSAVGRPRKKEKDKAKPSDRLICDICNEKFTRSHRWSHNQTKVHQAYMKMNDKMKKILLNED